MDWKPKPIPNFTSPPTGLERIRESRGRFLKALFADEEVQGRRAKGQQFNVWETGHPEIKHVGIGPVSDVHVVLSATSKSQHAMLDIVCAALRLASEVAAWPDMDKFEGE